MSHPPSSRSARLQVLAAALLFSTGGAAIKAVTLTNWQVACGRSLLAAVVLLAAGGGLRRVFAWRPAAVGAAQAATLVTFVTANKLTTAANAVFLQATAPFYIALLGPFLLGERLRRRDIPLLVVIGAGVVLLFVGAPKPLATAPHPVLGTVVGVVSGFCWALTVMGLRWLGRRHDAEGPDTARAAAVAGNLMAFAVCLPLAFPVAAPTTSDVLGVGYLGVFQVGAAYLLLASGMGHVPAAAASLLLLAEPAFSPLWAWVFLHESPGFWPLVGGVLIIAAATVATWHESRSQQNAAR